MPPIILPGGIVLDPHDAGAQQVQAHAEGLGLRGIQVFQARVMGAEQTYFVVEWLGPVFQHAALDAVTAHLNSMIQAYARRQKHVGSLCA